MCSEDTKLAELILAFVGIDTPKINQNNDIFETRTIAPEPSADLRNLSFLSRSLHQSTMVLFDIMIVNEFARYESMNQFVDTLNTEPDFGGKYDSSYKLPKKQQACEVMKQAVSKSWHSFNFGKSVLTPIKSFVGEKQKNGKYDVAIRHNNLLNDIAVSKKNVVDFYDLKNIRVGDRKYMDMKILITDPTVANMPEYQVLQDWHDKYAKLEDGIALSRNMAIAKQQLRSEMANFQQNQSIVQGCESN